MDGPRDRLMAVLALLVFTDTFGYAIVLPLLPLSAQRRGAGALAVGALFATYSAFQLLCAPLLGRLSDRYGRRPILLLSLGGSVVGFALMLVGGYLPLLVSRVVDGGTAGNISVVNAVVLDRFPRSDWGARFTILSTATGLGILAGIAVSAGLAQFGLAAAAVAAIVLCLVSAAILWRWLPETAPRAGAATRLTFPRLDLQSAVPAGFAATVVQSAFLLTLPLYFNRLLGWRETPATLAIAGLIGLAAAFQVLAVGRLMALLEARRAAMLGFGLLAAGGVVLTLSREPIGVLLAAATAILGVALLSPAVPTLIGLHNRSLREGEVMGVNQSVASAGQMTGPILGYGALQLFAAPGYGVICAALAAGGLALTYRLRGGSPGD